MIDINEIKAELAALADSGYAEFTANLIPGISEPLLGVRMPALRRLAKRLTQRNWQDFIEKADHSSQEMNLLQALVLGEAQADWPTMLPYIDRFINHIHNWAVCDSFAAALKLSRKFPEETWQFLLDCLDSTDTYRIRFAVVMIMNHYMRSEFVLPALAIFNRLEHEDYYVKMAVAWAVSMYYVHFPRQTLAFLQDNAMDNFTHNKAIQKIRESRRVSQDDKRMLNLLKRK
jgi:3-methyladenine DNA glycosylase AlkD